MTFAPIAIIGRACLLPGANSPEKLWENSLSKNDCLTTVPDNFWKVSSDELENHEDKISSYRGGYIYHFDTLFTPQGFHLSPENILNQDTLTKWLLHVGRLALQNAKVEQHSILQQTGVIMGNLSYPTVELSEFAYSVWSQQSARVPHHRFMSGYPIITMAKCLGLNRKAFAIDAACASSLYAIKLACDELHTNRAELMLAGGINCADDLYLHKGFTALQALSLSGQSRPFHHNADGLVPAQGCAIVVLKLLENALKDEDKIYGVIRGIGLSNDGGQNGFLAPAMDGQIRAMKNAYEMSGIQPKDISWIDCHATGTKVGDKIEMESMQSLFEKPKNISLGTLKANIGHTITASGCAALINVLSGFEHHLKIPSRIAKNQAIDCPFELLESPQEWGHSKIAAVNSFGFGGNNAHLIVQAFDNKTYSKNIYVAQKKENKKRKYGIIAIQLRVGNINTVEEFKKIIQSNTLNDDYNPKIASIKLPIKSTKFSPVDLQHTLGQQLVLLELMHECMTMHPHLLNDSEHTGVYIGMQTEPDIARFSVKWRGGENTKHIMPKLTSAHVLGCMPNIVTNRLNNQYNFKGPSYSVSCEENSGLTALHIGLNALAKNEINTAIIGAVDLSCEKVHNNAVQQMYSSDKHQSCDAGVIFVVNRLVDINVTHHSIFGVITEDDVENFELSQTREIHKLLGYSHCSDGILNLLSKIVTNTTTLEANNKIKTARQTKLKSTMKQSDANPKIAFVFTGAQTSYPKMGEGLFKKFLLPAEYQKHQNIINKINSIQHINELSVLEELKLSSFMSQLHAKISREYFGLVPDICIGHCAGETNALFAMDVWEDQDALFHDLYKSGLYHHILTGEFSILQQYKIKDWQSIRIMAPVNRVTQLCEKGVYVTIINTHNDCVISGDVENCKKTVRKVLTEFPTAGIKDLPYSMVIHCPEFLSQRSQWKKIHTRKINHKASNFCLYSAGTQQFIENSEESIANALTQLAMLPVDFPQVVERAWNSGVRIFIEHGPRNLCTGWIRDILGNKPHLAISYDVKSIHPMKQLLTLKQQLQQQVSIKLKLNQDLYEHESL